METLLKRWDRIPKRMAIVGVVFAFVLFMGLTYLLHSFTVRMLGDYGWYGLFMSKMATLVILPVSILISGWTMTREGTRKRMLRYVLANYQVGIENPFLEAFTPKKPVDFMGPEPVKYIE